MIQLVTVNYLFDLIGRFTHHVILRYMYKHYAKVGNKFILTRCNFTHPHHPCIGGVIRHPAYTLL